MSEVVVCNIHIAITIPIDMLDDMLSPLSMLERILKGREKDSDGTIIMVKKR